MLVFMFYVLFFLLLLNKTCLACRARFTDFLVSGNIEKVFVHKAVMFVSANILHPRK